MVKGLEDIGLGLSRLLQNSGGFSVRFHPAQAGMKLSHLFYRRRGGYFQARAVQPVLNQAEIGQGDHAG